MSEDSLETRRITLLILKFWPLTFGAQPGKSSDWEELFFEVFGCCPSDPKPTPEHYRQGATDPRWPQLTQMGCGLRGVKVARRYARQRGLEQ